MSAKSMMSRYSSTSSTASTRMQVDECKAKILEALELKRKVSSLVKSINRGAFIQNEN